MAKATFEVTFSKLKKKQFNEQVEVLQDNLSSVLAEIADDEGLKFKGLVLQGADFPDPPATTSDSSSDSAPKSTTEWDDVFTEGPWISDNCEAQCDQESDPSSQVPAPSSLPQINFAKYFAPEKLYGTVDSEGNVAVDIPEGYTLAKVD
jgi:hypothetical protein